jgi:hypothetical protein
MSTPLRSWRDTPTKQAIFDFVAAVTGESGPKYIPPPERVAVFDNDGTLMLRYTDADPYASLCMLANHDDAAREFDYTAGAEDALKTAQDRGWLVVSVKDDFKTVFAFQAQ